MTHQTGDTAAASRPYLGGIESLRAYAAGAILIFHVIHLAGVPVPRALEFMKWFFGFGVPLFFVVSAFSLAYGYEGRLSSATEILRFYVRRIFRIAPLFYAFVVFTLVTTGGLLAASPGLLAANLAFAFNLFPALVDGIAPASWSIGVEMLFYLILPFVLMLVRGTVSAAVATLAAIAGAMAYSVWLNSLGDVPGSFIQHGFLFNLPYFGFGLLAYFLYRRGSARLSTMALLSAAAGLLILYGVAHLPAPLMPGRVGNTGYQALWGAPFALLCLAMAWRPPVWLSNPAAQFVGKISFSLYLVHPHVITGLKSVGAYGHVEALPGGSGVHFPLSVLLTLAVAIPVSAGLYQLIEEPGMALGRDLANRLQQRQTLRAAADA